MPWGIGLLLIPAGLVGVFLVIALMRGYSSQRVSSRRLVRDDTTPFNPLYGTPFDGSLHATPPNQAHATHNDATDCSPGDVDNTGTSWDSGPCASGGFDAGDGGAGSFDSGGGSFDSGAGGQ